MILKACKTKNFTFYYVQKSFRTPEGKCSTKNVERLGNIEQLKARFGEEDPVGEAKKYVAELTRAEKEARKSVMIECNPAVLLKKGEQRSYNGGYLFLQKIYYELGLDYICRKIEKKHRNKFDLNGILSRLLYTRLLYPGSKLSSLEDSMRFIEQPQEEIHQVYRALSMLAGEFNEIQADVYRRSLKIGKRDTGVVCYDLTNYFFEWEEEGGLVQYGHSKEGRPLPIVQMGLFVDREGFPLAMCIEPGNKAESATLKPMEEILKEKFGLSRIIVCTDAGLSTYENRKNDAVSERSFITVQSVKKMDGTLQDWALSDEGWSVPGSDRKYNLAKVNSGEYYDTLFYKERWDQVRMSTGEILEQRPAQVTPDQLEQALTPFRGNITQIPPMYSAIKINGKKLYELARKGREVERPPRKVTIHALTLESREGERDFTIRVRCSKGTYVRTLCHDIGQALGCGGCMSSLRRTMAAGVTLEDAVTLDEVQQAEDPEKLLLPVDAYFAGRPVLILKPDLEKKVRNGMTVILPQAPGVSGECRVYGESGEFLALGKLTGRKLETVKSCFSV